MAEGRNETLVLVKDEEKTKLLDPNGSTRSMLYNFDPIKKPDDTLVLLDEDESMNQAPKSSIPFATKTKDPFNASPIPEVNPEKIIISAPEDVSTEMQTQRILTEFNKRVKKGQSCFTQSIPRGTQIPAGKFWLGIRNNIPELRGPSTSPIAITLQSLIPGQTAEILNQNINQSDPYFGTKGSYVLNVPVGHFAKASSGNKQLIFGEGCHIIHDPNFNFSYKTKSDSNPTVVDQNSPYIENGAIHILRVPMGKFCKIFIGQEAFVLPGRKEPYYFNHPLFKLEKNQDQSLFIDQNIQHINHGNINILRIPVGKVAKVTIGQECKILIGKNEPYIFHDPSFRLTPKDQNNPWFDQLDQYIQHGPRHILRVPKGKYAKVLIGNEAKILPGRDEPYEYTDPQFKLIPHEQNNNWFDQTYPYIQHGPIHILRIPKGKYAKGFFGNEAKILDGKDEPYEINDPQFKLLWKEENKTLWFDQSEPLIQHGNITKLRIPPGRYAKVTVENKAIILYSEDKHHEYNTPNFKLEKDEKQNWLFSQTDSYIQHGTQHIIRVPDGKIAKAWIGSEAKLLEAQKEPHKYDDASFYLERKSEKELFFDATAELIKHGNIKRVIPGTNRLAIVSDNGTLKTLKPDINRKPHIIDSAASDVKGFIETSMRTLLFPAENDKLDCYLTSDSLKIGLKLLVAFTIKDPDLALTKLKDIEGILSHIENVAKADMGKAIRQSTSQEYLDFFQTRPENAKTDSKTDSLLAPTEKEVRKTYQDLVKIQLAEDLEAFGIELVRLNIEKSEILNEKIASEMSQASLKSAQTNVQVRLLGQENHIAQTKAKQEADTQQIRAQQAAETKRIEQEQANNAQRSAAQAKLDAETLEANALIMKAKAQKETAELNAQAQASVVETKAIADAKAIEIKAAADAKAIEIKAAAEAKAAEMRAAAEAKAAEMRAAAEAKAIEMKAEAQKKALKAEGDAFNDSPGLLEERLTKIRGNALGAISGGIHVTSNELAALLYRNQNQLGLFALQNQSTPQLQLLSTPTAPTPSPKQ